MQNEEREDGPTSLKIILQPEDGVSTSLMRVIQIPIYAARNIREYKHDHVKADLAHVFQFALVLLANELVALHGPRLAHDLSRLARCNCDKMLRMCTYGDNLDTDGNVDGKVEQENQRVEQVIEEQLQGWIIASNPTP